MSKTIKVVIGIIVLILIVGGIWYGVSRKSENKELIKIGVVLPLTGSAAEYGQAAKNGVDLAIQKIKATENVDINIIYEDSQMDPKKAVDSIQKLINIDNVKYVVGFSSGETLAMCPIADSNKVILLTTGTSPKITTECGDYTFRNMPSDIYQGKELAQKVYERDYKNIAILYINNDYGVGLKDESVKNFKGEVLITESYQPGDNDFKTQLMKIKSAKPDAILLITQLAEGIIILKQRTELDLNQPIFASEALKDPSLIANVNTDSLKNVYIAFISQHNGAEFQEFKNNYFQKYGSQFGVFSDYVYDNTLTLGNALIRCDGNTDCVKGKIYATNIIGATGSINFDANGDRIDKPYTFYKVENGDFVPAE